MVQTPFAPGRWAARETAGRDARLAPGEASASASPGARRACRDPRSARLLVVLSGSDVRSFSNARSLRETGVTVGPSIRTVPCNRCSAPTRIAGVLSVKLKVVPTGPTLARERGECVVFAPCPPARASRA